MIAYLDANGLLPSHQSALRKNHSTETLLIRLLSDLYGAMETGKISLLTHFDVSSAFDSVEHSILLHRLYISFGLTDKSLQWLSSFLSDSGVHPPEAMMHFPLCFRFPPTLEQFSDSVENFQNFKFSRKISRLSSVKISDDFFSHRPQISNFPLFSLFQCISLCFAKIIISPYFEKFPPCFRKIHLLFTYLMCISFPPYFDHDAFMHHPMHVQYWTPLLSERTNCAVFGSSRSAYGYLSLSVSLMALYLGCSFTSFARRVLGLCLGPAGFYISCETVLMTCRRIHPLHLQEVAAVAQMCLAAI